MLLSFLWYKIYICKLYYNYSYKKYDYVISILIPIVCFWL